MTRPTEPYPSPDTGVRSSMAVGLTVFAGAMMLTTGLFQAFEGIVAIANDSFYVNTRNYIFEIDTTTWGWIHLLLGVVVALVGGGVLSGATPARVLGIVLVVFSMIANFLFIPYYPLWSLMIVALDVAVIWALSQSTSMRATQS